MTSQAERVTVALDTLINGQQIVPNARQVLSVYVNACPVGFVAGIAFGGLGQPTYDLGLGESLAVDDPCAPENDGVFLFTDVAVIGGVLELNVSYRPGVAASSV